MRPTLRLLGAVLTIPALVALAAVGPGAAATSEKTRDDARPFMELHLLFPAYRGQLLAPTAKKNLRARIVLNRKESGLEGKPLGVAWTFARGEEVIAGQQSPIGPGEDTAEWGTKLPDLENGPYHFRARLLDEQGQEVASETRSIEVVSPAQLFGRVWIDEQGRTIVSGRPFFPLGLYLGPTEDEHLERIAAAGFNTILCYGYGVGPDPKAFMDRAQAHGLKVIYSIKDFYEGTKSFPNKGQTGPDLAREYVTMLRDHPALLAWYTNDELGESWIPQLRKRYDLVRQLDEKHPTFQVLCRPDEFDAYYNVTDVLGVDPYPIPSHGVEMVGDWMDKAAQAMEGSKPVWIVPQLHKWAIYTGKETDREPTFEEKRAMAYLGIIHGAQGMIFYSYYDLFRDTGKAQAAAGVFERRWDEVSRIASEMKRLIPIVLGSRRLVMVVTRPGVHASMLKNDGQVFVIAVNTSSDKPADLLVQVPVMMQPEAEDMLTGSKTAIEERMLRATFRPLEVKVFKIEHVKPRVAR